MGSGLGGNPGREPQVPRPLPLRGAARDPPGQDRGRLHVLILGRRSTPNSESPYSYSDAISKLVRSPSPLGVQLSHFTHLLSVCNWSRCVARASHANKNSLITRLKIVVI